MPRKKKEILASEKEIKKSKMKKDKVKPRKFWASTGKRKSSVARVRLCQGKGRILINNRELENYFPLFYLQKKIKQPLALVGALSKFDIIIKVSGGGISSQAEACRHGIAKALQVFDKKLRPLLKKAGWLKRDARVKERKKPGLKRARRAPQWQKR